MEDVKWLERDYCRLTDKIYVDLNVLKVVGGINDFKAFPKSPQKKYFDDNVGLKGIVGDYEDVINNLKVHLGQYATSGKLTIFRYLWLFFRFQAASGCKVATEEGVEDYIALLHNDYRSKTINAQTAYGKLSAVNNFLMFSGKISKRFASKFGPVRAGRVSNVEPYRKFEFNEIIKFLFSLYEFYEKIITEHVEGVELGYRKYPLGECPRFQFRYQTLYSEKGEPLIIDEITYGNPLVNYMVASYYLFVVFTWGNFFQIINLKISNLSFDDGDVKTDYVFKGRAHKFVRYSIGNSEFFSDKSGYRWFKKFLALRSKIVSYFKSYEGLQESEYLFFSMNGKNRSDKNDTFFRKLDQRTISAINNHSVIIGLRERGFLIPNIATGRIRKTAEQLTDQKLSDPFVITSKAQHQWNTYRNNYAHGNKYDAREEMSAALKTLQDQGINSLSYPVRKELAKNYGVTVVDATESIDPLLNGLGCQRTLPISNVEKKYFQKQRKFGSEPKVCADFSNCIDCEKSCVIDQLEPIYNLISFKYKLEHSNHIYQKSQKACHRYHSILDKINLRLSFVSKDVISKAEKKLRTEGVAKVWQI